LGTVVEGSVERVERGRIGVALNQHAVQALQVSDGVDRASVLGDRSGLPSGVHCPGEVTVVCAASARAATQRPRSRR
jgi:hypothetical protein